MKCFLTAVSLIFAFTAPAYAQTGDGSLRGYVRDESGAVLPGVTVTTSSDVLLSSVTGVTDSTGYYRLNYLPPGIYTLKFELSGFAIHVQENITLRAGSNYGVDATLRISSVEETITVTAETPMLEIAKPSNVLNVTGDFQREMPIQARRNWSDFLELTPGVHARNSEQGGSMVYMGHAADIFAHVTQIEGMIASSYQDAQLQHIAMGYDMMEDIQVKTGGVDAASPMGTGVVINVVTKRGGNDFSGTVGYDHQPLEWNGDNAPTTGSFSGTPTTQKTRYVVASLGGPLFRDRAWFFGSFRWGDLENGIGRTPEQLARLGSFSGMLLGGGRSTVPDFEPFNNTTEGFMPYFKFTAELSSRHELSAFYQRDHVVASLATDQDYELYNYVKAGGNLLGGKMTSLWGATTTTQFTMGYNDKTRDTDFDKLPGSGPHIRIHEDFVESRGELNGTGLLARGGNISSGRHRPASLIMIRGDLTHYKEGWGRSHEFQTGIFLAPRCRADYYSTYSNFDGDGWYEEEHRLIDPANPSLGTVPFARERRDVGSVQTRAIRDRDIGIYVQDSWRPAPRLTLNLGLRADFIRRYDGKYDFTRMNTIAFGPRAGFSFLVTEDARNVLRGSIGRIHEAVNGRDAASVYSGAAGDSGGHSTRINQYDRNGDGIWETEVVRPPSTLGLDPTIEFDPDLIQPFVDEYIVGFRKQFPGLIAVDTALIHRSYKKTYALVDVNGIYPEGSYQPFIGFGRANPNRGIIYQQTNNTWSRLKYTALEITVVKRLSHRFQATAGINKQWHEINGTWNPGDPARFIQPDHFPNNKALYMPRGDNEHNSLRASGALVYAPTWRSYSIRLGGTYLAPGDVTLAASYTQNAGPWTGVLIDKLSKNDPEVTKYGPPRIRLENGTTAPNPLATVYRFVGKDRSDGQVQAPAIKSLGLKVGKRFRFWEGRELELAASIFNVFNWGDFHQYDYTANRVYSPTFLQMRNLQTARALQLNVLFRY